MAKIEIYTKSWCGYSAAAKALLDAKGATYREIDVTTDRDTEQVLIEWSGRYTVPQIFIDGQGIGGYEDLAALDATGALDRLLNAGTSAAA